MYCQGKIEQFKVLRKIFRQNGFDILPIKLYDDDEDLDIVVIPKTKYKEAKEVLVSLGFRDMKNLSRFRETLKRQFVSDKYEYIVHLHSTISWNGIEYIDPELVWHRKVQKNEIFAPSPEDEILIIVAHSIFENKRLVPTERKYYKKLLSRHDVDWKYIRKSADDYNWLSALDFFLGQLEGNKNIFNILHLLRVSFSKFGKDFRSLNIRQKIWYLFSYTFIDYVWCYRNTIKKIRKESLIAFVGLDGSGKTTQARLLYDYLKENSSQPVRYKHFLKSSSSNRLGKAFKVGRDIPFMSIARKALAIYDIFLFRIWRLFNGHKVVCDRFFYDVLVHIKYFHGPSEKFEKFYLRMMPKAKIFYLDVSPDKALARKKEHSMERMQKKHELYKKYKTRFIIIPQMSVEETQRIIIEKIDY